MSKPIIIVSNTPLAPTGYGQQTKQLAQRIKAERASRYSPRG